MQRLIGFALYIVIALLAENYFPAQWGWFLLAFAVGDLWGFIGAVWGQNG